MSTEALTAAEPGFFKRIINFLRDVRTEIGKELPKMAGAELKNVGLDSGQLSAVQQSIDEAFVSGFRLVVIGAAILALAAGAFGAGIRPALNRPTRSGE